MSTSFGLSTLELGNVDEYSLETIHYANDAHFYWVEEEEENAREPMRLAAEGRHDYCMNHYATILFEDLCKEKEVTDEHRLLHVLDLKFTAAIIGIEEATCFIEVILGDTDMKTMNLLLNHIPTEIICRWIRGEYGTLDTYPEEILSFLKHYMGKLKELILHSQMEECSE